MFMALEKPRKLWEFFSPTLCLPCETLGFGVVAGGFTTNSVKADNCYEFS